MKTDKWFKENGFTEKIGGIFEHYYRPDPSDKIIGQKIKLHYNDSNDCYYAKWQLWTGSNSTRECDKWYPPLPKREDGVKWECETDNEVFWNENGRGDIKAIEYIKEHSDEKFKLLRDFIEKKQKNT